jgi:hypothetical protein
MSVFNMVAPGLGFAFKWEPESRRLYVIHNDEPMQVASNIMSPEAAQSLAMMWCKGYRHAQLEAARKPGVRHYRMFAERGIIGADVNPPVTLGKIKD